MKEVQNYDCNKYCYWICSILVHYWVLHCEIIKREGFLNRASFFFIPNIVRSGVIKRSLDKSKWKFMRGLDKSNGEM